MHPQRSIQHDHAGVTETAFRIQVLAHRAQIPTSAIHPPAPNKGQIRLKQGLSGDSFGLVLAGDSIGLYDWCLELGMSGLQALRVCGRRFC